MKECESGHSRPSSASENLTARIRRTHPEIANRSSWKISNVGSTINLKDARTNDKLRADLHSKRTNKSKKKKYFSSIELEARKEELLARARMWETRIALPTTFTEKFILQVVRTYETPQHLLSAWDASGDARISIPEFRMQIRSLGFDTKAVSVIEIDALFRLFDTDYSAFLSLKEVENSFKLMQTAIRKYLSLIHI